MQQGSATHPYFLFPKSRKAKRLLCLRNQKAGMLAMSMRTVRRRTMESGIKSLAIPLKHLDQIFLALDYMPQEEIVII